MVTANQEQESSDDNSRRDCHSAPSIWKAPMPRHKKNGHGGNSDWLEAVERTEDCPSHHGSAMSKQESEYEGPHEGERQIPQPDAVLNNWRHQDSDGGRALHGPMPAHA